MVNSPKPQVGFDVPTALGFQFPSGFWHSDGVGSAIPKWVLAFRRRWGSNSQVGFGIPTALEVQFPSGFWHSDGVGTPIPKWVLE